MNALSPNGNLDMNSDVDICEHDFVLIKLLDIIITNYYYYNNKNINNINCNEIIEEEYYVLCTTALSECYGIIFIFIFIINTLHKYIYNL